MATAQLTLTVDTVFVPRILEAFGALARPATALNPTPATAQEVTQLLGQYVQNVVLNYESEKIRRAAQASVQQIIIT